MRASRIVGPAILAVAAIGVILLAAAADLPGATYRRGDFFGFWAASRAVLAGASPYDVLWFADLARGTEAVLSFGRSVYPPWTAIALVPFALLPFPLAAAAWLALQLGAVVAVVLLFARRIGRPERPVFLAIVAASQPLWLLVVGGNITGLLTGTVGGSVLAAAAGRPFLAGAFFGVLALKPHPFLLLVVAALLAASAPARARFVAGSLVSGGLLIGITLVLHPIWIGEWLASASALQATSGSNATLWTVGRIARGALPVELATLLAAVAVLLALAAWVRWYRAARPALWLAMAAALPISLAVAPHGWSYDQLVLVIPIAVILRAIGLRRESPRRRGTVIVALVATIVPWALYALAFRRGGEELSALTPLLVFAALWYLRPSGGRLEADPGRPAPILR